MHSENQSLIARASRDTCAANSRRGATLCDMRRLSIYLSVYPSIYLLIYASQEEDEEEEEILLLEGV
jgi:hypothetical protein